MKILFAVLAVCFASSTSASAEPIALKIGAYEAALSWEAGPHLRQESVLLVQLADESRQPAEPSAALTVELWMPSMGHGSAPTAVQRVRGADGKIVPGLFRVTNIYFLMGGDWELRFQLPGELGGTATYALELEGSGGHH